MKNNTNIVSLVLNKVVELQGGLLRVLDSENRNVFKGAFLEDFEILFVGRDVYFIMPSVMDELCRFLSEVKADFTLAVGFYRHTVWFAKNGNSLSEAMCEKKVEESVRYVRLRTGASLSYSKPAASQPKKAEEKPAEKSKLGEAIDMTFIKLVMASLSEEDIDNIPGVSRSALNFIRHITYNLAGDLYPLGFLSMMLQKLHIYKDDAINYFIKEEYPSVIIANHISSLREGAIAVLKYACECTGQQKFAVEVERHYKRILAQVAAARN